MKNLSFNHLLSGAEITTKDFENIIQIAQDMKTNPQKYNNALKDKIIALIFDKPSLRTRFSFSAAIIEMGGNLIESVSASRKNEQPKDFIRVIQNYCSAVVIRTFADSDVEEMVSYSKVPIINALTDLYHPCQTLADLLTLKEVFGSLDSLKIAYIGDSNNILYSLLLLANTIGLEVHYACPKGHKPDQKILDQLQDLSIVKGFDDPKEAVKGCDAVYTDVWCSMGFEPTAEDAFVGFQVNKELMSYANDNAIFMHCMPMERGKEVSEDLPDDKCSAIFQQSLNRKFVQKALLYILLGNIKTN
ncbi:ornithine carbamoyltransferase [Francisella philomiragia]|uniref:Ornithine carbamoyltransferase n=1 Tax=Francisella philomiragia subsp. philomiragia (strain ATCC 25017 / CCUG 19701 / FSC 153 / O\|nr:ornithine carbamoyltransferase [Francisella philomiragia]AJI47125.1 ornithine carbamoyltransferase [Francisella philomiragia]AJI49472.1 ornithine carbamoyltransferase [Francisella philomiragia]MBK2019762.1 ornithine carbamoyltransferase [Francisella philomiragia]MBK2029784.1 ornithine carbamoyltransferase [Francisella philomiragia]MBK2263720.1 ornithine carbamoyltransferase [Francisella philomiragia]